jgi:glycosyltransferase involved in cell wall biosynthesis
VSRDGARPWRVLTFAPAGVNDGIGDFSALLGSALATHHPTETFVRRESWRELDAVDPAALGGVVIQYFPQAYLHGDFRYLVRWLERARRADVVVVTTVHEFWPPADGSFKRAAGRWLFRRMLRTLVRLSDRVVLTRPSAVLDLGEAVRTDRVTVIPVGTSVLPPSERPALPGEPVAKASGTRLVMFGQPAAMDGAVVAAVSRWLTTTDGASLEWVARSADEMRDAWRRFGADPAARVTFSSGVPADELSRRLSAASIGLAPNVNGTSTRRGTFVALLAHGLPVVATSGPNTGDELVEAAPCLFSPEGEPDPFVAHLAALAADPARRDALGRVAHEYYDRTLAWRHVAGAYAQLLTR